MRTPLAILSIATIGAVTSFQLPPPLPSATITTRTTTRTASLRRATQSLQDDNGDIHSDATSINLSDDCPKSLGPKRTFLGMRRESGIMRRMMMEQQQLMGTDSLSSSTSSSTSGRRQRLATSSVSTNKSSTALSSSATALMPDGGLSPCVIKVLGVGGGGSNAVSVSTPSCF
jgi:cell division protein FtsZ